MISCLKKAGIKEISEDSSGNAGASIAAYASKAKIKSHIFAPSSAPNAKINQIKVYGAKTYLISFPVIVPQKKLKYFQKLMESRTRHIT